MTQQATIANGNALVVVLGATADLVASLREAVNGDDPFAEVLAALTASGVRNLPSLAVVAAEPGAIRVLVRGQLTVEVHTSDGGRARTDGQGVSTWAESLHPHAEAAVVHHDGAETWFTSPVQPLLHEPTDAATPVRPEPPAQPEPAPDSAAEPEPLPAPSPELADGNETILPNGLGLPPEPELELEPDDQRLEAAQDEPDFDLANLFETRYRGVEAAAVRPEDESEPDGQAAVAAAAPPLSSPPASESLTPADPAGPSIIEGLPGFSPGPAPPSQVVDARPGDHDGLTISAAELARLRTSVAAPTAATAAITDPSSVQAVLCPVGHTNAPRADRCRSCGQAIVDRSISIVKRPILGRLRFDSGMVVDVDRPLLLGRKPTVEVKPSVGEVPALVTLPDPDGSLSRLHAEVRLDGWEVMVVDRGSTNGTYVELPGRPKTMLRPHEPLVVVAGTRISLADVATCQFEVGGQ